MPDNVADENKSSDEILRSIAKDLKEVKTTVTKNGKTLDNLATRINTIENQQKSMKEDIDFLYEDNFNTRNHVNDLEQYQKKSNIVISGIPEQENENLLDMFKNLAKELDVNLNEYDVIAIHRLPPRQKEIPQVIVRLLNHDKKAKLVSNAKNIKPTINLIMDGNPSPIYISDHLSKANANLFKKAKDLKKAGLIKYAWVKNCKIYARESDESKVYHITSYEDLKQIETAVQNKLPQTSATTSSSTTTSNEESQPVAASTRYKKKNTQQNSKQTTLNRYQRVNK